jgi:RNA polymerase sigma-70 factor (ECF subfamily)
MALLVPMWPNAMPRRGGGSTDAAVSGASATSWVTDKPRPAPARGRSMPLEPELAQLIERARCGQTDALGALYDRYSPAIYRYLYRRSGDSVLAEDLTGTVFLRMLEALKKEQAWEDSFSGWLYRIAHNLLTDHMRARGRRPESELPETLPAGGTRLEDRVDRAIATDAVRKALYQLKPEYTEVLLLRFTEGLSHADVAARLGKTETAVKVTQHRALKALRLRLGSWLPEEGR